MDGWLCAFVAFIISIHDVLTNMCPDNRRANKKKGQRQQTTNFAAAATTTTTTTMLKANIHRQGANKPIKRLQSRMGPTKSKATVKNKPIKCALGQSVCFFSKPERNRHRCWNINLLDGTSFWNAEISTVGLSDCRQKCLVKLQKTMEVQLVTKQDEQQMKLSFTRWDEDYVSLAAAFQRIVNCPIFIFPIFSPDWKIRFFFYFKIN